MAILKQILWTYLESLENYGLHAKKLLLPFPLSI